MKITKLKKIPVIIYSIIIIILSSRTQRIPQPGTYYISYFFVFLHIGEFGLFIMLLMLGFYPEFEIYYLVIISLIYATFDEVYQYFIPTRFFDIIDILSNIVGIILGVIFCLIIYRIRIYRIKVKLIEEDIMEWKERSSDKVWYPPV